MKASQNLMTARVILVAGGTGLVACATVLVAVSSPAKMDSLNEMFTMVALGVQLLRASPRMDLTL